MSHLDSNGLGQLYSPYWRPVTRPMIRRADGRTFLARPRRYYEPAQLLETSWDLAPAAESESGYRGDIEVGRPGEDVLIGGQHDEYGLGDLSSAPRTATGELVGLVWGALAVGSVAASAYHGIKRNNGSIGWGLVWGFFGGLFPVVTPTVAYAQGFAQPAEKK